jgi:HEAT repeat protein
MRSETPVASAHAARDASDVESLLTTLAGTDLMGRRLAALALGDLRSARAVVPLIRCLHAKDEPLRNAALKALGSIGDRGAVDAVFEAAVTDESFGVRATAAQTLARLEDPRAVEVLGSMLLEEHGRYARSFPKWAAKELVEIGDPRAIPMLDQAAQRARGLTKVRLRSAIRRLERVEALRTS